MRRTIFLTVLATAAFGGAAIASHGDHAAEHPAGHSMGHTEHCGLPAGEGVIQALDVKKSTAKVAHKPIESIGWDEMVMDFAVAKPVDLSAFGQGENVHFLLKPEKAKQYSIAMMCSADVDKGAHEACMKAMHETAMKVAAESGKDCSGAAGAGDEHGEHGDH